MSGFIAIFLVNESAKTHISDNIIIGSIAGGVAFLAISYLIWHQIILWHIYNKRRSSAARQHNWQEAVNIGRKQLTMRKGDIYLWHDMALALRRTGDADAAYEMALKVQQYLFHKQSDSSPEYPEDYGDLSGFYTAPTHYLRSMQVLADTYLERGQAELAKEAYQYLVGIGGRFVECNLNLAEACLRLKEPENAVAALRRLMATAPLKAVKIIRRHFNRLLGKAPLSKEMRDFQVEFLKVEGRAEPELKRLKQAVKDNSIQPGELTLLTSLAISEKQKNEICNILNTAAKKLAQNEEMLTALAQGAENVGAHRAVLEVIDQEIEKFPPPETTPEMLGQLRQYIHDVGVRAADDLELNLRAAEVLGKTGDLSVAKQLLSSNFYNSQDHNFLNRKEKLHKLWLEQVLYENYRMLHKQRESDPAISVLTDSKPLTIYHSSRYQKYLNGQALSEQERPQIAYDLTTAMLETGKSKERLMPLLQEIAIEDTVWRQPALIRLARLLSEQGDTNSADQYYQRISSLEKACEITREEVLKDAYELAMLKETKNPETAGLIYRDISLIDLNFKDVRARRDSLLSHDSGNAVKNPQSILGNLKTNISAAPVLDSPNIIPGQAKVNTPPPRGISDLIGAFGINTGEQDNKQKLVAGSLIDSRYVIESILGEGGMGTVYKATDNRLKRVVAIKVIRPEASDSLTKADERFELEAQLAGRLFQHPGVITILDLCKGPPSYIVMEFVEGISLRDLLAERSLQYEEIIHILYQTADTLGYAHNENIVHRDIKPANIMIEYMPLKAKVADFGLAKLTDSDNRLTVSGTIVGTRYYMSPEQIIGQNLDGRSDIYSWAIMAYEMCTGDPPFLEGEIAYQHVHVKPEPLHADMLEVKLPQKFLDLLMQCLEKSCDNRPSDFNLIKANIREIFPTLRLDL